MEESGLIRALTSALAPVFLISGVAAILAAMNVRFGRVIDRAREVMKEAKLHPHLHLPEDVDAELRILLRRARHLRIMAILASLSIFSVSVCIFLLFLSLILDLHVPYLIPAIFSLGLLFLIVSLGYFIEDFALSLGAVKREIRVALGRAVTEK